MAWSRRQVIGARAMRAWRPTSEAPAGARLPRGWGLRAREPAGYARRWRRRVIGGALDGVAATVRGLLSAYPLFLAPAERRALARLAGQLARWGARLAEDDSEDG